MPARASRSPSSLVACCSSRHHSRAPTTLRLDGVGPLKLGMRVTAARQTGWLAGRRTGCPLGGPPLPVTYRLSGRAPRPVFAASPSSTAGG